MNVPQSDFAVLAGGEYKATVGVSCHSGDILAPHLPEAVLRAVLGRFAGTAVVGIVIIVSPGVRDFIQQVIRTPLISNNHYDISIDVVETEPPSGANASPDGMR